MAPGSPVTRQRLSPTLQGLADGAASVMSGRALSAVDSALVEAISRSVAEQLCMMSLSAQSARGSTKFSRSSRASEGSVNAESRTSSQKDALKRFTKELHKYAEQTNASGKILKLTPSSRSPATLHTVSALLPYRQEFTHAGLAVTSKDQARKPSTKGRLKTVPSTRRNMIDPTGNVIRMSQMDGKEEPIKAQFSSSESSFVTPGNIDDWHYALIDEVPIRTPKSRSGFARSGKGLCIPCFRTHLDERGSIQENVKRSLTTAPVANVAAVSQSSTTQARADAPSHIPIPPFALDSAEPSPRHLCDGTEPMQPLNAHLTPTGYRRPSMTISKSNGHLESCRGGHNYKHPDVDIHKHNPRPTTTQHLHPEAAVRPQAGLNRYRTIPHQPIRKQPATRSSHLTKGASLPTLPVSSVKPQAIPRPLRHTVGHLPKKTNQGKRTLVVRNPAEPVTNAAGVSAVEELFPSRASTKRTSGSRKGRSKLLSSYRFRPAIPLRASSILQSIRSTEVDKDKRRVTNRLVLRGLHVATSAACDEKVDAYVADMTGVRIRQLLADLVALETYWNDTHSSDDKEQRARQRRAQMRKMKQHMRQSRQAKQASSQSA